ncbi:hypothetical protein BDB01DRAFT_809010 [Pilobolus umbonatus]|nr:hypothetical protein BDB01DRAFT_809010 [Pilobolus umbonatus]
MFKRKIKADDSTKGKRRMINYNEEVWKLVFADGLGAYKEAKYEKAVSLFTRALELNPGNPTVLDSRAVCYERLDKINLAMKDATDIINTSPSNSRGYLRMGKLLSLNDKHKAAFSIYIRGLIAVKNTDPKYQQLLSLKTDTQKLLNPPKKHDFMSLFPYEIISNIFSRLSFIRRIHCSNVSRNWRNFTIHWPGMWRDLDFGAHKVSLYTMKAYLSYAAGKHVHKLTLKQYPESKMRKILELLIHADCQYMEILELTQCDIPLTLFLRLLRLVGRNIRYLCLDGSSIPLEIILKDVLSYCTKLTHLSITHLPETSISSEQWGNIPMISTNIQFLRFTYDHELDLSIILQRCPRLRVFHYFNKTQLFSSIESSINQHCTELREIAYSPIRDENDIEWPTEDQLGTSTTKGLRSFVIDEIHRGPHSSLNNVILQNHATLEEFVVYDGLNIDNTLVNIIKEKGLPLLKTLGLHLAIIPSDGDLDMVIHSCPKLEHLTITKSMYLTDKTLSSMAISNLKTIDLNCCINLTGIGLKSLINTHKDTLESVDISDCPNISRQALEWAGGIIGSDKIKCRFS